MFRNSTESKNIVKVSQVHQAPNLAQLARIGRAQAARAWPCCGQPSVVSQAPRRRIASTVSRACAPSRRSPTRPAPTRARPAPTRARCVPARPTLAPRRRCSGYIAIQPCLSPSPGHNTLRCIAIQCPTASPSLVTIQNCIVTHFPSKPASSIAIQNLLAIQFQPILAA